MTENTPPYDAAHGTHVEPDQLMLYSEGMLEEAEADEIRRHLTACRACARELLTLNTPLDFEVMPSDPPPQFESGDALTAHARNDEAALDKTGPVVSLPVAANSPRSRWLPIAAIAACFVIASFFWPSRRPPSAYTNLEELSLVPASQITRGDSPAGQSARSLVLRLNFAEPTSVSQFGLVIRGRDTAAPLWESAVARQPDGSFLVMFDSGFFAPGAYEVTLLGEENPLATYAFRISK